MPVNHQIKRQLRQMPYREMCDLSGEIAEGWGQATAKKLAEVLTSLPTEISQKDEDQNAYLRDYFSRKRSVVIVPRGAGWAITMSGKVNLTIHCTDLREGMSQMFDTLIGYLALDRA